MDSNRVFTELELLYKILNIVPFFCYLPWHWRKILQHCQNHRNHLARVYQRPAGLCRGTPRPTLVCPLPGQNGLSFGHFHRCKSSPTNNKERAGRARVGIPVRVGKLRMSFRIGKPHSNGWTVWWIPLLIWHHFLTGVHSMLSFRFRIKKLATKVWRVKYVMVQNHYTLAQ